LLTGKAAEASAIVPTADSSDYDLMKESIPTRIRLTNEHYRELFRKTQKQGDQSFTDYGEKLVKLLTK